MCVFSLSIPMLLLLMYLNGVTVVETILNISEKNTCPRRHTTSKPSCDGETLMRYKSLGVLLQIVALVIQIPFFMAIGRFENL